MTKERLGQRLQRMRKEKKLGLREAAGKVDVSPTYLSRIENDEEKSPPSEKVLQALASLLEDDVDELMALAGRVAEDVERLVTADKSLPQFLRTASARGFTGEKLMELMEAAGAAEPSSNEELKKGGK